MPEVRYDVVSTHNIHAERYLVRQVEASTFHRLWSCLHEVVTCSGVWNPLMSLTLDAFRNNGL
jgi:hypothetical protein